MTYGIIIIFYKIIYKNDNCTYVVTYENKTNKDNEGKQP
jgi:hypothetical protein